MKKRQIDSIKRRSENGFVERVERAKTRLKELSKKQAAKPVPSMRSQGGLESGVLKPLSIPRPNELGAVLDKVGKDMATDPSHLRAKTRSEAVTAIALEAIIVADSRPPFFISDEKIITDGRYGIENNYDRTDLLDAGLLEKYEKVARNVGSVDLILHPLYNQIGTGWMVADNIVVTNRHVAEIFARKDWHGQWKAKRGEGGEEIEARINFLRQHKTSGRRRVEVEEVLYVSGQSEPDMAFLKVTTQDELEPLDFFTGTLKVDQPVAAIGYPSWDGERNDLTLMDELFGGIYGVKRFSPGMIDEVFDTETLLHDCSTLGGCSGSPIIELETQKVVGLHFAGVFNESNYAVTGRIVKAALDRFSGAWAPGFNQAPIAKSPIRDADYLKGRRGYNFKFLGVGGLEAKLPKFGPRSDDTSKLLNGRGSVIKYHHFSVVQSASRKLPMLTAVNIDGRKLSKHPQSNSWHFDPRISLNDQSGNELYKDTDVLNPLDRGHMVRRLDPCWGSKASVLKAQRDTYHYTNSAPQHLSLNRRHWVGLEDYILDTANAKDLKVSVMTGPIFRDNDPTLSSKNSDVQIPQEYWKTAILVNADTGALSLSAYILSQGEMIKDFTEAAFVFGEFETYQVPLTLIEKHTGYDFGSLRDADTLRDVSRTESAFKKVFTRIQGPNDLKL